MVYILNTEVPENKPLTSALKKIYGIGKERSNKVRREFGICSETKLNQLPKEIQNKIINFIEKEYLIGNDLKKILIQTNNDYIKIRSYKGSRIKNRLPRRGQRTHTNSKTIKKIK
jgi:small subunit ribosomal protein S13